MKEPTNEQVAQIAWAATTAAKDKAKELGVDPSLYGAALGLYRAVDALEMMAKLHEVLGDDGMTSLAKTIEKSEAYEMMKEAEEAVNGSE